jgi:DNA-binding response OmpR family regulator
MRVLIADDDPVCLRILQKALDVADHELLVARDGREAWDLYQAHADVPLVITDWLMPHVSGLELCERIRAEARERYSYIVIVTTLSDKENTVAGFRAGADDYLVKPVSLTDLQNRIRVAARVRGGMDAKVEATLRSAVELCQEADPGHESTALLETVRKLGGFYRERRAFTKARAFLRRQIALVGARGDDVEAGRLRRELEEISGLEDRTEA